MRILKRCVYGLWFSGTVKAYWSLVVSYSHHSRGITNVHWFSDILLHFLLIEHISHVTFVPLFTIYMFTADYDIEWQIFIFADTPTLESQANGKSLPSQNFDGRWESRFKRLTANKIHVYMHWYQMHLQSETQWK